MLKEVCHIPWLLLEVYMEISHYKEQLHCMACTEYTDGWECSYSNVQVRKTSTANLKAYHSCNTPAPDPNLDPVRYHQRMFSVDPQGAAQFVGLTRTAVKDEKREMIVRSRLMPMNGDCDDLGSEDLSFIEELGC